MKLKNDSFGTSMLWLKRWKKEGGNTLWGNISSIRKHTYVQLCIGSEKNNITGCPKKIYRLNNIAKWSLFHFNNKKFQIIC